MENLIIYVLTSPFCWLIIFLLSFVIPITITLIRRKNRKKGGILNKNSLIIDSDVFSKISIIWFLLFFIIVGMILIYFALTKTSILSNKIIGIIFGGIICLISTIIIINNLKEYIKIKTGNYIIVLDELSDKYYYNDTNRSADSSDLSKWQLFFKDYFKKYNLYVPLRDFGLGRKYNIGDKFYLVFLKGDNIPYIYSLKEYILDESEKNKLKTLEAAKEFINAKEFILKTNLEKKSIGKDTLIADFKTTHKKNAIMDVFICLFSLICCLIPIFIFKHIVASIITSIIFIFFAFSAITKIKYVHSIIKNIKLNQFKIKIDVLKSLDKLVDFKNLNQITSFRFENYKKIVFADKKDYNKINIGDEFYLVFVKGEKEPIKVYKVKDSILEDDIKDMIV